jgi:hypothetical protein
VILISTYDELFEGDTTHRLCQQEVMVLWLNSKVLEYRVRPKSFHMVLRALAYRLLQELVQIYPVLDLSMSNWIVYAIT